MVCNVCTTEAESQNRGEVAVFYRDTNRYQVENTASFDPNMVSFLIMAGVRRRYVAGAYVTPTYMPDVHRVKQVLRAESKGL